MTNTEESFEQPPNKKRKTDSSEDVSSDQSVREIDENFYSRQLYVLGHEAMRRMASSDVLISGLGGLGVEVAKNVILGGVKSVTLHDASNCSLHDLSSQFFLTRSDIGANRAEACCRQLSELNNYVVTQSCSGELTEAFLKTFKVVVLTDNSLEEQLRISSITHPNKIALIVASTKGLFAQVFCDFGDGFEVVDSNGENPVTAAISCVTRELEGIVTCVDDCRHGLEDGDFVTFSDVQGMTELNNCDPKAVRVKGPYSFSVGDTSRLSSYTQGGFFTQVKISRIIDFKPLSQALENPQFVVSDGGKPNRPLQLHLAFKALHRFEQTHGRSPLPWSPDDASEFVELSAAISSEEGNDLDLDVELIKLFSKTCSGNVSPVCAIIGGVVGQEVMKACSGKFSPIYQWLYFDAVECLPGTGDIPETDCQPSDSRYDGQVAVFGKEFQNKLKSMKYFVVGAGAVGCELLKTLAMMGVGEINRGLIVVSDMELIEKSNLHRQFLFRSEDVHKPKSSTAAEAVRRMNLNLNVTAYNVRAGPETENIFNDDFFQNLDGVAIAVDNLEARKYIDQRCVFYQKPLLEAGTLGTKGSTQIVIPLLTETYSSSQDPEDKTVPFITLKHFPYAIEHTILWARDTFEGLFKRCPEIAVKYLNNPNFFNRYLTRLTNLETFEVFETVKRLLVDEIPYSFEDCTRWACNLWQEQFSNQIKQLLHKFPPDHVTDTGQNFWSSPKRRPRGLCFSVEDPLHFDFVFASANLIAAVYGIPQNRSRDLVAQMLRNDCILDLVTSDESSTHETSEETGSDRNVDHNRAVQLLYDLPPRDHFTNVTITPLEFDKDNDSNFHMDFIVAASNLRAMNYRIRPADRQKSKLIAGNISPAIATTSSVVAGLLGLELIKLSQGFTNCKPFKNGFFNLALPLMTFSEPVIPWTMQYYNKQWTVWDRFEIEGELTLEEFLQHFRDHHRLRVYMVHHGSCVLYSEFLPRRTLQELLGLQMTSVLRRMSDSAGLGPHVRALSFNISCHDFDGNDLEVPYVWYVLPLTES